MSIQVHPSDSTLTPDLRILPVDLLVEHEYNDMQRTEPLARRLESEGLLKNPPVVTPLGDATRALRGAGWRQPRHGATDSCNTRTS